MFINDANSKNCRLHVTMSSTPRSSVGWDSAGKEMVERMNMVNESPFFPHKDTFGCSLFVSKNATVGAVNGYVESTRLPLLWQHFAVTVTKNNNQTNLMLFIGLNETTAF